MDRDRIHGQIRPWELSKHAARKPPHSKGLNPKMSARADAFGVWDLAFGVFSGYPVHPDLEPKGDEEDADHRRADDHAHCRERLASVVLGNHDGQDARRHGRL